jgi:hypothetical protein
MDDNTAEFVACGAAILLGALLAFTFTAPMSTLLAPLLGNAAMYVATVGLAVTPVLLLALLLALLRWRSR